MRAIKTSSSVFTLVLFAAAGLAMAQDQSSPSPSGGDQQQTAASHGWRRVTDPPPPVPADEQVPPTVEDQTPPPAATDPGTAPTPAGSMRGRGPLDAYGQPRYGQDAPPPRYTQDAPPPRYSQDAPPPQDARMPQAPPPVPDRLTIKPGTYLTVRVNQLLSSDHNQPGDAFTATLMSPVVVDGIVLAQRGQTVAGRVAEAKKAGRVEGVSRLGVQLTELTAVDGQQLPLQAQLIGRSGDTSHGRDAVGIGATTAAGAAIGAGVNGGVGAGVGAGAGLVVGVLGVLLTRGSATYITPESVLTFRVEAPITVDTARAPQAFRYVQPGDYAQTQLAQRRPAPMGGPRPVRPRPYYYGPAYYAPYPYPYYPAYWGPSFGVYFGPGFYHRGYYRRWR